jgi:GntR family transcriptional regulator
MLVAIDPEDARPVFKQIVDEVERSVATGVLKGDDPLPPVRDLARQLKVNPNTVQQAYRELVREGTAYVRRGVGTFVTRTDRRLTDARRAAARRPVSSRRVPPGAARQRSPGGIAGNLAVGCPPRRALGLHR